MLNRILVTFVSYYLITIIITLLYINLQITLSSAELLGFDDYIPPYANVRGQAILRGVNYASAAAGIRDETGRQLVRIF